MKTKRVFTFLLLLIVTAAFVGCTASPSTGAAAPAGTNQASAPAAAATTQAAQAPAAPENTAATTGEAIGFEAKVVPFPSAPLMNYPIEGGAEVSIWIPFNSTAGKYYQSYSEVETVKQLEKDTGISVNFVHPPSGQEKENFNLLVVSDSLPDILVDVYKHYTGGETAGVMDGVFADLTDIVASAAPDYNYFLENNDLFRKLATSAEGKVYSIYNYKDVQAPFYHRPHFRGDWLEEWGMKEPKLLSEYEAYFDKVLAEKPGVAPFLIYKTGLEGILLGTFDIGSQSNGGRFFVKEGKIHHTFDEPGLLDYLTTLSDWYAKGYISKDFTTISDMNLEFANERVASLMGNTDTLFTYSQELGYGVVTGPNPRVNEGDPYHHDCFYFPQNGNPNSISGKSQNKETALAWLNYGFTHQGSGVANFGQTGVTWEMGSDGIPVFTDFALNNPDIPLSDAEYTLRLHTCWAKYRYGDDISMIRNVALPETWEFRARWGDDPTSDSAYAMPTLSLTSEQASEAGRLTNDINTYAEEMVLKFITGASPLSEFDSFSANVQSLGMPRLLEIYQDAYNAFLLK